MAGHRILVEVVVEAAGMARQLSKAKHATSGFEKQVHSSMHSVRNSIAFATGGFLAFATIGEAFRETITAARSAAVANRQLATQLEANGTTIDVWKKKIEEADLELSRLSGFNAVELESSLTLLLRSTGSVTTAMRINADAADVARGRHIGLQQAAVALGKAWNGQTTALRRLGIAVPKHATRLEALAFVEEKFKGQAEAGATASQRFGAELHNTEVIIGTGVLPTLNRLLAGASKYLANLNETGDLQRDVESTTNAIGDALKLVRDAVTPLIEAWKGLNAITGSTRDSMKLLLEVFVAFKVARLVGRLGDAATAVGLIGRNAKTSAREVKTLNSTLGKTALIGVIPVTIALTILESRQYKEAHDTTKGVLDKAHLGFLVDSLPQAIERSWKQVEKTYNFYADMFREHASRRSGAAGGEGAEAAIKAAHGKGLADAARAAAPTHDDIAKAKASIELRNRWFDALVGRQIDIASDKPIKAQIAALEGIAQQIRRRIAVTKDITRQLTLEDKLREIARSEQSLREQAAADAADAAQKARDKRQQEAENRVNARNARQFKALGLTGTGDERAPGVKHLKAQLGNVKDAIAGTILDTKSTRSMFAHIRTVLAGGLGAVGRDVRLKIKQILDDIENDIKNRGGDQTKFRHISTDNIVRGLGLSPQEARKVKNRLSQIGAHGTIAAPSGQFALAGGSSLTINGGVHLHGVQDLRKLEGEFTKRHKARAHVRRGART